MKAHIGVDADSGLVHTVRGTSGNVNDVVEANSLLHGDEAEAFADAAFLAIAAGASYRVIPWQMGVVSKLLRLLPNAVFDRVLAGRPRKHRTGE